MTDLERRIAALEDRIDGNLLSDLGVDQSSMWIDQPGGIGATIGATPPDPQDAPCVAYAVTGTLLYDAFDGLYDDDWDFNEQDWYDEVPDDYATLGPCWLINVTGASPLPSPFRFLGVLRDGGNPQAAGPFFVTLVGNNDTTPPDDSWLQVTSDPTDILAYPIVVVASVTLADGQLTIAQAPDQPMQLDIIITDGGSAITAGSITLVDPTQAGSEEISLIGTTATYTTTGYYTSAMSASIAGLVGGSSTTIEIKVYQYPQGELVTDDGDIWVADVLDPGPPEAPNWTNLGESLTAVGGIAAMQSYALGVYGQEMRPIVAIQSSPTAKNATSPTLCQLWIAAAASGAVTVRTLTDNDGNVFCLPVPTCLSCGPIQPCSWPTGMSAIWCVSSGYYGLTSNFVGTAPGNPFNPGNDMTGVSGIYANASAYAGTIYSAVLTLAGCTAPTTGVFSFPNPNDPSLFIDVNVNVSSMSPFTASGSIAGVSVMLTSDQGLALSWAGNFTSGTCPGSTGPTNPVIGPCNPPTPSAGLTLSAARKGQLPVTYTLSQTSALTLAGTFAITGVSGTFTHTITYDAPSGTYWSSLVNSTAPTTFSSSPVSVACSPFTVGSVTTSPLVGTVLTLSYPFGLTIASASTSTVVASSSTPTTSTNITITVTLKDASSGPVANKLITLSATGSSTGNGSTAITNSSGVATFTVSDATAQSVTYGATDTTDGIAITATASVTWGAGFSTAVSGSGTVTTTSGSTTLPVTSVTNMSTSDVLTIVSGGVTWTLTVVTKMSFPFSQVTGTAAIVSGGGVPFNYSNGDAVTWS